MAESNRSVAGKGRRRRWQMKFVARTFQTCFRRRWVASRCSRDLCRSATRRPEREKAMRQSRMVGTARRAVRRWFLAERSPRRGDPTLTRPPATDPLREKRFFDVFDGIETARSAMCDKNLFVNPKGIASFSPGFCHACHVFWAVFSDFLILILILLLIFKRSRGRLRLRGEPHPEEKRGGKTACATPLLMFCYP